MSRVALHPTTRLLDVHGEAALAQAPREFTIFDASHMARTPAGVSDARNASTPRSLEPAVGRSGQSIRAVVDVEQYCIESSGVRTYGTATSVS